MIILMKTIRSVLLLFVISTNLFLSHCYNEKRCGKVAIANREKYFIVVKDDCSSPKKDLSKIKTTKSNRVYKRAPNELMLFRIVSGSQRDALTYFRNEEREGNDVVDGNGNFRSVLLDDWPSIRPVSMNVTLLNDDGYAVAWLQFKVKKGDTLESWFNKENLISSFPWKLPLLLKRSYQFFSVQGYKNELKRSFYINVQWGGCPIDVGVLAVLNQMTGECDYAKFWKGHPYVFPQVIYAEKNGQAGNWNTDSRPAKSMEIIGKYDSDVEIYI